MCELASRSYPAVVPLDWHVAFPFAFRGDSCRVGTMYMEEPVRGFREVQSHPRRGAALQQLRGQTSASLVRWGTRDTGWGQRRPPGQGGGGALGSSSSACRGQVGVMGRVVIVPSGMRRLSPAGAGSAAFYEEEVRVHGRRVLSSGGAFGVLGALPGDEVGQ